MPGLTGRVLAVYQLSGHVLAFHVHTVKTYHFVPITVETQSTVRAVRVHLYVQKVGLKRKTVAFFKMNSQTMCIAHF